MRDKIKIIIVVAAFVIQPLLSSMLPAWLAPDLIFCVLVVMTMVLDVDDLFVPIILIFVLSLLSDIYHSQYVGVTVVSLAVISLGLLQARKLGNIENIFFSLIIAVCSSVAYGLVYWLIYAMLSSPYSFGYMFSLFPKTAIINVIAITVSLFIVGRDTINQRRDRYFR